ncbi:MAG: single-stranded DNA-binding protein [Steroidobacteraceae bacterium]
MKIEVKPGTSATVQSGTRKDGKAFSLRVQEAWLHAGGEIRKLRITLNREQEAFAAGWYGLDESSFGVNRWGDLEIRFVNLKALPLVEAAKAAGAR